MEYKKIKEDKYTIHLINTNRFKTINIVIFFTKIFEKKDIPYGNLLSKNLVYSTKKYNTKAKCSIKGEELYNSSVASSSSITGNCSKFTVSLDFLNPKYVDENYLEDCMDFLYEVLFNPNVNNNKFYDEYFNIIKKDTIVSASNIKDNALSFASNEYNKLMYKGTPAENSGIPAVEELEEITSESLYDYYKELNNGKYKIDVALYGEFDNEEEIVKLFNKKFNKLNGNNNKLSFEVDIKYNETLKEKQDSLKYNQSKLYMGYYYENLNEHQEKYVLRLYNTILGTMNDSLLFNIVREKNSLCYSIGSFVSRYVNSLTVYAGINKDNYEKAVKLIKECKDKMGNKNIIKKQFESAKKTINTYINTYYDDCRSQIDRYYYSEFENTDDIEEIRDKINKVSLEEVIEINDKIHLNTIYLLKGDN